MGSVATSDCVHTKRLCYQERYSKDQRFVHLYLAKVNLKIAFDVKLQLKLSVREPSIFSFH